MVSLGVMRVPRSEVQINRIHINDENIEVTRNDKILMKLIQKFAFRIYFFQKHHSKTVSYLKANGLTIQDPALKSFF